MEMYVGLDIGGTKIQAASVDHSGAVLRKANATTPINLQEGIELVHSLVTEVAGGKGISAIGAAIGGPLDWETGVVSPLHQPQWRQVPLKSIMQETHGCPFYVDVDTNIAAIGEHHALETPPERLLYITISTGMGGGFLIGGKVYRGKDGAHPEIAHQAIRSRCGHPERVSCECGQPDCLEALISGNGIQRVYRKPSEALDTGEWEEVAYNLGQGLRNLVTILAPDLIILGGGVALGGGDPFLRAAEVVMRSHLNLVPPPEIRLSVLGYNTPLIGATIVARKGLT